MTADVSDDDSLSYGTPPSEHTREPASSEHSLAGLIAACVVMVLALAVIAVLLDGQHPILATVFSILGLVLFPTIVATTWSTLCRGLGSSIGFALAILLITVTITVIVTVGVTFATSVTIYQNAEGYDGFQALVIGSVIAFTLPPIAAGIIGGFMRRSLRKKWLASTS